MTVKDIGSLPSQWAVLIKFGQREHLEALRSDGLLHMSPQSYFAQIEGDAARSDPFEGTDQIHQPADIERLTITGAAAPGGGQQELVIGRHDLAGPLSITLSTTRRYNLFCMYGLQAPLSPPGIDERCLTFGDSFVLILNTQAFLDRAYAAVAALGFDCEYRFVEHYDASMHSGETGVFRKPMDFVYQQEFRIAVWPGLSEALQVRLGSLTDITTPVLPLAEINRIVDFGEAAARDAGLGATIGQS